MCYACLARCLVAADAVGDQVEAGLPCLLVPATTELSWQDMAESSSENVIVVVWNVPVGVLLSKTFKLSLEGFRLVKELDGNVESSEDTTGVSLELW